MDNVQIEPHKRRTLGGPQAEADLAHLHRRFRSVSRRQERALFIHRLYRATRWWALIAVCIAILLWGLTAYTRWPLTIALRHVPSFAGCEAATYVGLAPAASGRPGYWERNGADGDGVSCEN